VAQYRPISEQEEIESIGKVNGFYDFTRLN